MTSQKIKVYLVVGHIEDQNAIEFRDEYIAWMSGFDAGDNQFVTRHLFRFHGPRDKPGGSGFTQEKIGRTLRFCGERIQEVIIRSVSECVGICELAEVAN